MEGQVAMVTGGAMGIGKAYVEFLLSRKIKVCIADVNEEKAKSTIDELTNIYKDAKIIFKRCDVTKEDQVEDAMKKTVECFGRIDIVINNAGIGNESKYDEMIAINMNGVVYGTKIGIKYLKDKSDGSVGNIINTASTQGIVNFPLFPVYCATKHAVLGFTRSVGAVSLSRHNVRVNCICPSGVDTAFLHKIQNNEECYMGTKEELDAIVREGCPDDQILKADDVAKCLPTILDDPNLTGAAVLCALGHKQEILKLPSSLEEAFTLYLPKKK